MKLPQNIPIGRRTFAVVRARRLPGICMGLMDWTNKTITLATHDRQGNRYSAAEMYDSFVHEVAHAVLRDMRHPLWNNERFVVAFSRRLAPALKGVR